jgi:hypothetical protein
VLLAVIGALALAASAQAKDLVLDLPAHVIVQTYPLPGPNDLDRCLGASFVEFPDIRGAKSYRIVATDVRYGQGTQERYGPPFPADHFDYGSVQSHAHWDAPPGFHRVWYSANSTGKGCAQAILGLEGQWKLVSAKVNMSQKFKERLERKDPEECKVKLDGVKVKLPGSPGRLMAIVRRAGHVTVQDPWVGDQPYNLHLNSFATKGSVITTGPKSVVTIGTLDGNSVNIGPGMKVRIDPGRQTIEVLERTKGDKTVPHPRPLRIRTSSCTLSSRG